MTTLRSTHPASSPPGAVEMEPVLGVPPRSPGPLARSITYASDSSQPLRSPLAARPSFEAFARLRQTMPIRPSPITSRRDDGEEEEEEEKGDARERSWATVGSFRGHQSPSPSSKWFHATLLNLRQAGALLATSADEQELGDDAQYAQLIKDARLTRLEAVLLVRLQDLELVYVRKLRVLVSFFRDELVTRGPAIARMKGASVLMLSAGELLDFHENVLQMLRLIKTGLCQEPPLEMLVAALIDASPLYITYAQGWRASSTTLAQLMTLPRFASAAAQCHLTELRQAPLEQVQKYIKWASMGGLPDHSIAMLRDTQHWIDILIAPPLQYGAVHDVNAGVSLMLNAERIRRAAFHMHNAVHGHADPVPLHDDGRALTAHTWLEMLSIVRFLILFGFFILSLVEMPSWCYGPFIERCNMPPPGAPAGSILYNSGIVFLDVYRGLGMEILLAASLFLCTNLLELLAFSELSWHWWATLVCEAVIVADALVSYGMAASGVYRIYRLSVWMRPPLMCLSFRTGRSSLLDVLQAFVWSAPYFFAIVVYLVIAAVVATSLWGLQSLGYDDFWLTLSTLQMTLVTGNYPDVMLSVYYNARTSFIFFLIFIIVGSFFFLSLILGEIRNSYAASVNARMGYFFAQRQRELLLSYAALAMGRSWIPQREVELLFGALIRMYPLSGLGDWRREQQAERAQILLDNAESRTFNQEAWLEAAIPAVTSYIDGAHFRVRTFFAGRLYKALLVLFICANAALAFLGVWAIIYVNRDVIDGVFWAAQGLLAVAVGEAIMKTVLYGGPIKATYYIRFELVLLLLGIAVDLAAGLSDQHQLVIIWNMLVSLRLLPLLAYLQADVNSLSAVASLFFASVPALIATYLSFAWVGIYVWGGLLYKGNPRLATDAQGIIYSNANYFVLNWNDVASSLVSQFVMLVGNNVGVLQAGCVGATGWGSRAYFLVFWIWSALILLNLFVASVFRLVDMARQERVKQVKATAQAGGGSLAGDEMVSLANGVYKVELQNFQEELDHVFGGAAKRHVQLKRGASVVFSQVVSTLHQSSTIVESILDASLPSQMDLAPSAAKGKEEEEDEPRPVPGVSRSAPVLRDN